MAAATENSTRVTSYWGNTPVEMCSVTWTNGDTFVSQFGAVKSMQFTCTTAAANGCTKSGKTVTFASGGSLSGELLVIGDVE